MGTSTAVNGFTGSQVIKSSRAWGLVSSSWLADGGVSVWNDSRSIRSTEDCIVRVQSAVRDEWLETKTRRKPVNAALKFLWSNALASSKCRRLELLISSSV